MPFVLSCCSANNAARSDDEAGPSKVPPKKSKEAPAKDVLAPVRTRSSPDRRPSLDSLGNQQPYTPALALSLFNTYIDPDTADTSDPSIGSDGFERLCSDAQIPLDGALPLVLAWMLDAQEMAKIGKDEWVKGTAKLQCVMSSFRLVLSSIQSYMCPQNIITARVWRCDPGR